MRRRVFIVALAIDVVMQTSVAKESISADELARIEHLCNAVARSKDTQFIRNGVAHSPDDAAKFLHEKLKAMGDEVSTAEEFIDKIASKSSTSGQPYTVRFADGREILTADFLRAQLARKGRR